MISYIDPGSASYFFMLLIGGLIGSMVKFKDFWRRVWHAVTGRGSRTTTHRDEGPEGHDDQPADRGRDASASATASSPSPSDEE